MIFYTILRMPHEIRYGSPAILLICAGIGIAVIVAIVVFVWTVITALANASLRNDLD